jgi:hypothetical protein
MGLSDGAFFMIKHTPIAQLKSPHLKPHLLNGSSRYVGAYFDSNSPKIIDLRYKTSCRKKAGCSPYHELKASVCGTAHLQGPSIKDVGNRERAGVKKWSKIADQHGNMG